MSTPALTEQPHIGRPRLFTDAEEFQAAIDAYFAQCDVDNRPYTMAGLARTLGCSTSTLRNYENQTPARAHFAAPAFVEAVKSARHRVEQWTEERLFGKGHPAGPIFSLKNNFGWKDVQEVEHTHTLMAIGQPGSGLAPQLEPPVIDVTPLSPAVETPIALSPASEIAVSADGGEAKATPNDPVSPFRVA